MTFSRIQLGTVQFGLNYGIANTSGRPAYETARDIICTAFENGVTALDTAAGYGDSELVLGRALAELGLKNKVQIISKVLPVKKNNFSAKEAKQFIISSVENSLNKLGVEQLSGILFHREEDIEYIDILQELQERGLCKKFGVSLDSTTCCEKALKQKVELVQLPYNILDRRFDSFLQKATKQKITVFARSVYLQGLLLMNEENILPSLQPVIPVRRKLQEIASEAGMDFPELCTRSVLSASSITSVLTGVDNLEQLNCNLSLFAKGPLPKELLDKIANIVPAFGEEIVRPACWNKSKRAIPSS